MNSSNLPIRRIMFLAALFGMFATSSLLRAQLTNPVKLMKGIVVSATDGKRVEGGRVFVYQTSNNEILYRSKINPRDGAYQFILNPSTTYRFVLLSPLFHTTEITVTTPEGKDYEETEQDMKMQPITKGETTFSGRIFAPNSAELKITPEFQKATAQLKVDRAMIVTYDIKADGVFGKAKTPASTAAKTKSKPVVKKKAGKKQPSITPPPSMAAAQPVDSISLPEVQIRMLVSKRVEALKAYFKSQSISLTQAVLKPDPAIVGASQPNVTAVVTSFDTDIDYENMEN